MPISAMISIIFKVFCDDAALYIFKLYSGLFEARTKLGNMPNANRESNAAIDAHEERKAKNSFPLEISLGIFAIASIFKTARINNAGNSLKC